jgi:RimJ/RimL family protein N-acetyltransferase
LATEAGSAAIQYGFEHLNLPYILGIVEPVNIASVKVLKKLGMRYIRETIFYGIEMDVSRLDAPT